MVQDVNGVWLKDSSVYQLVYFWPNHDSILYHTWIFSNYMLFMLFFDWLAVIFIVLMDRANELTALVFMIVLLKDLCFKPTACCMGIYLCPLFFLPLCLYIILLYNQFYFYQNKSFMCYQNENHLCAIIIKRDTWSNWEIEKITDFHTKTMTGW